jgi:hypothetical protein
MSDKRDGKTEIELTLKVKGVTIKLSVEDAKGLYEALKALVGEKEVKVEKPWMPYYPWPYTWWYTTYTTTPPSNGVYTAYCNNDTSLTVSSLT